MKHYYSKLCRLQHLFQASNSVQYNYYFFKYYKNYHTHRAPAFSHIPALHHTIKAPSFFSGHSEQLKFSGEELAGQHPLLGLLLLIPSCLENLPPLQTHTQPSCSHRSLQPGSDPLTMRFHIQGMGEKQEKRRARDSAIPSVWSQ